MKYFFDDWVRIKKNIDGKHLLLLLDYDGTLTPIVERPENAFIGRGVKGLLKKLSVFSQCTLAVISGRELNDIRNKVGLQNIIYVGNHGFQIRGPKLYFNNTPEEHFRKNINKIKDKLAPAIAKITGAFLEDKGFTLALHYREVNERDVSFVKQVFHENTIIPCVKEQVKIYNGKKVLEIRPPVAWNKGKVVLWLLARKKFACKSSKVLPLYIGDDATDEDAFSALRNKGITVVVGKRKGTHAAYYVRRPSDVEKILSELESVLSGRNNARIN